MPLPLLENCILSIATPLGLEVKALSQRGVVSSHRANRKCLARFWAFLGLVNPFAIFIPLGMKPSVICPITQFGKNINYLTQQINIQRETCSIRPVSLVSNLVLLCLLNGIDHRMIFLKRKKERKRPKRKTQTTAGECSTVCFKISSLHYSQYMQSQPNQGEELIISSCLLKSHLVLLHELHLFFVIILHCLGQSTRLLFEVSGSDNPSTEHSISLLQPTRLKDQLR